MLVEVAFENHTMTWKDTLISEIETILNINWDKRSGNVVPESDDVALKDGAVEIEATFLYADLAGSSTLAKVCPWETTAKIIRAYLDCCTRSIRGHGGHIRSFDGDRVMGVFKGDTPNTSAAKCAREIDWIVEKVINPKATEKFNSVKNNGIKIRHCVGIDTGSAVAVRAGIRNNNDLIWIGRAPSFAARLSDIRNYPYAVYITKACYDKLADYGKKEGDANVWEERSFDFAGEKHAIYRTKYMAGP
jgi:class 3 adenylate cyclase